jgi:hypothetical protein
LVVSFLEVWCVFLCDVSYHEGGGQAVHTSNSNIIVMLRPSYS